MNIYVLSLRDSPGCLHTRVDRATILGNPFDWQVMGAVQTLPHYLNFIRAVYKLDEKAITKLLKDPSVAVAKTFVRRPAKELRAEIMRLATYAKTNSMNLACWCTNSKVTGDEPDISGFKCHAEVLAWVILTLIKKGLVEH